MRRLIPALIVFVTLVAPAAAQWKPRGEAMQSSVENGASRAELFYDDALVELSWLSPHIVRVRYEPGRRAVNRPSFARVARAWPGAPVKVVAADDGGSVRYVTSGIRVRQAMPSGALAFEDAGGRVFLEEDPRAMARRADGKASRAWMKLPTDEHYFGFGEKSGPVDKRGKAIVNWNTDAYYYGSGTDPLYQSIPFFLAIRDGRAYGLFLDAPERSSFDMGASERDAFSFGAESGYLDYYVIAGPEPKAVISRFTALTGRMPLPPHWALGYQQCRYSYYPEKRVREIAGEFRRRKIPCDAIYLDIDYMDGYRCFTWDKKKFPDLPKLIGDLRKDGFSTVVMIDPGIKAEEGYFVYDQGVKGDHFVKNPDGTLYRGRVWPGDCVFPDFHHAPVREWWGTLYRELLGIGVRGVWNDMNEPSVFNGPGGTMPLDVVHRVRGKPMPHAYGHNTYGMHMIRATRDGIRKLRPNERVFVLTRASYAGGQRYAAGWTGDNRSLWEHLEQSVPMAVNWGIAGLAFAGPDVGGFSGSPSPELLTRWMQMGALLPLYRNHTSIGTKDQEPWVHGEPYESANRRAVELRYRLLPYLYSLFREASVTGVPVARMPMLEFPTWEAPIKPYYIHQFMVGADLLVAPVVRIGETRWGVELPEGRWYDFATGAPKVSEQKRFHVDVALESLPMWVRAGAVIPMQSVIQHTGEKPAGPLVLRAYPGEKKRVFPFYEDDGVSYAYADGNYRLTGLSSVREKGAVVFRVESVEGMLGTRVGACRLEMFGVKERPDRVLIGGKPVEGWMHDVKAGRLSLDLNELPAGLEIRVEAPPPS